VIKIQKTLVKDALLQPKFMLNILKSLRKLVLPCF